MLKILQLALIAWLSISWVIGVKKDRNYEAFIISIKNMFGGDKEDLTMGLTSLAVLVGAPVFLVLWFLRII